MVRHAIAKYGLTILRPGNQPSGFIYRCPNTGLNVHGWIADDPTEHDGVSYEAVTCTACTRVHLVNPKSGTTRTNGTVTVADDKITEA